MVLNNVLETSEMIEIARTLTPLERQILRSLREKGPGALLEIAVRVLKFPNDMREPVANLVAKGLVTTMEFSSTSSGGALISLTRQGEQLARLLQDKALSSDFPGRPPERRPINSRRGCWKSWGTRPWCRVT